MPGSHAFQTALGREPRGPKQKEGDGRTPEGVYTIDWRSDQTRYTRELHISYPEMRDRERANDMNVEPGSAIFIHGLPRDYGPFDPPQWYRDWTEGCISVGNVAIVKIWDAVPDGTPIEIFHGPEVLANGDPWIDLPGQREAGFTTSRIWRRLEYMRTNMARLTEDWRKDWLNIGRTS